METPIAPSPPKERRIRKVRRLRKPVDSQAPPKKSSIKTTIAVLLLASVAYFLSSNRYLVNEFKNLALNQYQLYLHGRIDYCKERFDSQRLMKALRRQIINQDVALNGIETSFLQHENMTALALLGPQGVGKTMTMNIVQNQFQWHLNVQQYIWSATDFHHNHIESLNDLLENLSTCGQNGIFIDNIPSNRVPDIKEFHTKLLKRCNEHHMKCIVFYVFQFPTGPMTTYDFNTVKSINFRALNTKDVVECLEAESLRLKIELTPAQKAELLTSIDVDRNGCKTVAAKAARYTPK